MTTSRAQAREKGGWLLYILLFGAIWCLTLSIKASAWLPEAERLLYVALWGALVGIILARFPLPVWLAPGMSMVIDDLHNVGTWLWSMVVKGQIGDAPPFFYSVSHALDHSGNMVRNLSDWLTAIQTGSTSTDNTALWLVVALGVWVLSSNAAYELFHRRRVFAALLPLGIGIMSNVAFTDIGIRYVHVYLGLTLVTMVWTNVNRIESLGRLGIDYSPELKRDAALVGIVLATVILGIALIVPYTTWNRAVFLFWDHAGPKLQAFYGELDQAFAGRNPVPEPTPGGPTLPAHDIAVGGVLGKDVVLLVQTSDPAPISPRELEFLEYEELGMEDLVPKHYWRERTYDVYTGHGWDNSERETADFAGGSAWTEINYPYSVLTQTFIIRDTTAGLGYAVNEPFVVEQDYLILSRDERDFSALSVKSKTYTVISRIPIATEQDLQGAEGEYPDWVKERYLRLPKIPPRVTQAAADIVDKAGASTRYEKARAIEAYIRQLKYDLDIVPPPLDADIVDYFLFTVQRGYCDYSATAMVVMLRSVGVAARYASGFGMGHYDHKQMVWAVTGENAHAWVEVYFPGYGWIEFEPTPTQRVFEREASVASPLGQASSEQAAGKRKGLPPLWVWGAGLGLVLLIVIIWPFKWLKRSRTPRQEVWRIYARLLRAARWLSLEPYDGQTPREYMGALAAELKARAAFAEDAPQDIRVINDLYQRARYSANPITLQDRYRAEGAWRRLRGKLMRLVFVPPSHDRG